MSSEEQEYNLNLIERAKTDERAFEELYNMFFSELYGFVYKRVSHRETAEDIISISFTKVFMKIDSYQGDVKSFKAWLYKITTNTIIDHYRKQSKKKDVPLDSVTHSLSTPETASHKMELLLEGEKLNIVMQKLSRKDQQIIHLKFFAQLSNVEIAQQLNISANSCGVRIYRALAKLKAAHSSYEV